MSCCTDWPTDHDPALHSLYARKLLEPGWAGELTDTEAAYLARELTGSPRLRQTWRVAQFTRRRRAVTPAIAKALARWWAECPTAAPGGAFSNTVQDDQARRARIKTTHEN
jgi:hypothetical protein